MACQKGHINLQNMSNRCCGAESDDSNQPYSSFAFKIKDGFDTVKHTFVTIFENETVLLVVSIVLLYTPIIFFSATALGWYYRYSGPAIPVLFLIIAGISLLSFHVASFADAGVIPKQKDIYDAYDVIRMKRKHSNVPSCIEVPISGKFLRIKYCHTCNIYRPPRSVHCSVCDVCVQKFDHHCKWLGNCIGAHNYKIFYWFITFAFIETTMLITLSIIRVIVVCLYAMDAAKVAESSVMIAYIAMTGWFIACLLGYHTYLVCANKTTNEQLKALYADYNPWNRGVIRNCFDALVIGSRRRTLCGQQQTKTLYDPGRSVPMYFNLPYAHNGAGPKERRYAFDRTTDETELFEENRDVMHNEMTTEYKLHRIAVGSSLDVLIEGSPEKEATDYSGTERSQEVDVTPSS